MGSIVNPSMKRTGLVREIEKVRNQLQELELSESELKLSLVDARKQLSYYRSLVSSMKKTVSPSRLKKVIRLL